MIDEILILLVGAIIGSGVSNFYQRKQWLYQKRIEAFADLIDVIHRQRDVIAKYAFSNEMSETEKSARISSDFIPIRVKLYLASFLLSEGGKKEVNNTVSGFENRLRDFEKHPFAESNEYLGFFYEVDRLHEILQLEIVSNKLIKWAFYSRQAVERKKFEEWKQKDLPKLIENLGEQIRKSLSSSTKKSKP